MKIVKYLFYVIVIASIVYMLFYYPERKGENNLPMVKIVTELGDITIELEKQKAPITVENFLKYVVEKRFTVSSFYRIVNMDNQPNDSIKIEVIQGGIGFEESDLRLPPIEHESTDKTGVLHKDGVLSMARNKPGTASSEFFICVGDQPHLDFGGKRNPDGQGFAAFGRVVKGMDVVLKIHQQATENQMLVSPVKITDVVEENL